MSSARQGFFWWEVDLTYYVLRILAWFGIVSDLRSPTAEARDSRRVTDRSGELRKKSRLRGAVR